MRIFIFLRSLIVVTVIFPFWTVVLCSLNIVHNLLWGNRRINDLMIGHWARFACKVFGVHVVAEGIENVPQSGCLFLFNHRSFFDIFAIQGLVPKIRFGAKIELFKIPIFGLAMKRIGALPIARGKVEEVIRVYKEAEPRLQRGEQFALSPEGGRNTSDQELLPFKSGPFIFAISAGAPVVPVLVFGADQVWPKGTIVPQTQVWSSTITVKFLPPVEAKSFTLDTKADLQAKVYSAMKAGFQESPHA